MEGEKIDRDRDREIKGESAVEGSPRDIESSSQAGLTTERRVKD
jgi:hypothetical protein